VVLSSFITYRPVCNSNTTVPLENQELVTLPEHMSSPPVFRGVGVVLSNHYCSMWCFVDYCLSLCTFSFGRCMVCPSIYGFWLPLWYLLAIAWSVLRFTASDYLFGIFWPLHGLSFDLRLLITSLVSFGHCVVCPSIYGFWLPLWYLQTFLTCSIY
jgi:hypothetical protein